MRDGEVGSFLESRKLLAPWWWQGGRTGQEAGKVGPPPHGQPWSKCLTCKKTPMHVCKVVLYTSAIKHVEGSNSTGTYIVIVLPPYCPVRSRPLNIEYTKAYRSNISIQDSACNIDLLQAFYNKVLYFYSLHVRLANVLFLIIKTA